MKRITLLLLFLLCIGVSLNAQTYIQEDFNTTIPTTWTITDGGSVTGDTWASGLQGGNSLNGTNGAFVDDDAAGSGVTLEETLTTPVFDASGATALFLDFSQYFNSIGGVFTAVEVFDGTNWVEILNQTTDVGSYATPDEQHIDITQYANASMQVRFIYNDQGNWGWYWMIDDVIIYNATCPNPNDFTLVMATATEADFSWTAGGTETNWEVVVQPTGTGVPTGNGTASTATTYTESNLSPQTNYEAFLRSDCGGDFSIWVGPINFTTECTTFTAPYTQDFENAGAIPLCWSMSGGEDWKFNDVPGVNHIGDNGTITGTTPSNGYFAWVDASGSHDPALLTTPFVDVSTLTTPSISFYEISNNEGFANSELNVEVWDGAAWNLMATYNTNTNGWEKKTINISTLNITGDVQARFIFSEPVPGDFYDDIAIDDVTFDELPTCVNPSNITFTNITSTSADIAWISNGMETEWEVTIQPLGTGAPTVDGDLTTTNPYLATGLTPATHYEVYIRSVCGLEKSDWVGPSNFTTECALFTAPYTENFENSGDIPLCWTMSGGEDWNFDNDPGLNHIGNNGAMTGNTTSGGYFAWADASGTDTPATLQSPLVDVSPLTTPALSFFLISHNEGETNAQLDVEVWDGAAWNPMGVYNTNTNGWELIILDISSLTITGPVQARFIFSEVITPSDFYDDIAIDDVTFDNLPTCASVTQLTSNNLSLTSTEVSWTENGTATSWNVEYGIQGFTPGAGTTINSTTNPAVLTGLTADTHYDFYVQADCGTDGTSIWIGPGSFYTGYCESIPTDNDGTGVGDVTLASTTFNSSGDVMYEDHTSPAVSVFQGVNTNLQITFETGYTYNTYVWIDFDDNLVFDASELVYQGESTNANPTVLDASFIMPATAALGQHRMRIATADFMTTPDPCYNGSYGVTLDFTVDIQMLTCTLPEATFTIVPDCTAEEIMIDVDLTDIGDASTITISNDFDGSTTNVSTPGLYPVGPFPLNQNVNVYVTNDQNTDCVIGSGTLNLPACAPDNDDCLNATNFLANADDTCTNSISGTLFGATTSTEANACGGTPNDDVWFTFEAVSENQVAQLSNITGPTSFLSMGIYEGTDCNNLTNIDCTTADELALNGLTIGNTYYIRIFTFADNDYQDVDFDLCVFTTPPPITTSVDTYTVEELVSDVLVNSPCSNVSNITWSTGTNFGSTNGIGYFDANGSNFPFSSGVVLTTGDVLNAPGPESGTLIDGDNNWPGDADLEAEIPGVSSHNASVLEFDFVPFADEMSFDFIFAAEEYGTFQCNYSDAFAFLLTDMVTGVTTNIAVVPGTTTPISVFTIRDNTYNNGCSSENPALFGEYYGPGGLPALSSPTNFIGRTVPITAFSNVVPNRQYHIKLVIADDGDTAFDSAVFFAASSFQIGEIDLGEDILIADGNANCEGDAVTLDIGIEIPDNTVATWYTFDSGIQDPIAGENGSTLDVTETGTYIVELVFNNNFSCFATDQITVEFFPKPIVSESPTIYSCDDDGDGIATFDLTTNDSIIIGTQTNLVLSYHLTQDEAETNSAAIANPTAYDSTAGTVFVRVEDATTGCYETTTFDLAIADSPETTFNPNVVYEVCPNASTPITVTATAVNYSASEVSIKWYNEGVLIPGETTLTLNTVYTPGIYTIEVTFEDSGCVASENVEVYELTTCVIPQGISPNGDNLNDNFDLSSFDVQSLEIFNRYGTKVYSKTNYTNEWFGQSNDGDELPVGTYYYVMKYQGGKVKTAWVYINR
ncbi:choice-of-anchor L domain-containing protein [Bizionia paragorgiae]|uniref:Gliding motility-associated C-terminal domain-containing protein n=1 Tax=Bizionia paragorgiae TaxID=283786 RepID=A0A1H3YZZ2_BIZPA|nr:choice-of-anchor L domain-containing protein [Bizionia paragorgiae]SEA17075.1 gliding motility-associated C-terminal domain-containing protein [Bizionia paragorgiae]